SSESEALDRVLHEVVWHEGGCPGHDAPWRKVRSPRDAGHADATRAELVSHRKPVLRALSKGREVGPSRIRSRWCPRGLPVSPTKRRPSGGGSGALEGDRGVREGSRRNLD